VTSSSEQRKRRDTGEPAAPDEVLDRIPVDRVEPLLHRAIELEGISSSEPETIDRESLEGLALELGIDPRNLRRAVAEDQVRPLTADGDIWDRLLGPDRIVVSRSVEGTADQVEADVAGWLGRREGLRLRVRTAQGDVWERDDSVISKIRLKLNQGPGGLRSARRVIVRMHPIDEDEQLLVLEADAGPLQRLGRWLLAGVAGVTGLALVSGIAATGSLLGGLGALAGLVLGIPVVIGVRLAIARLEDGVELAADAIVDAERSGARVTDADRIVALLGSWAAAFRTLFGRKRRS